SVGYNVAENISDNGTPVSSEGTVVGVKPVNTANAPQTMLTFPGTSLTAPTTPSNPEKSKNAASSKSIITTGDLQSGVGITIPGVSPKITGTSKTPLAAVASGSKSFFNFEDDGLMILGAVIFVVSIWSLIGHTKVGDVIEKGTKGAAKTVGIATVI
ncbi:MAG: hypothetical protein ACRDFB_04310, partial [Rhabdochlamydiaceae bacterium]